jgi:hypothetical protein
MAYLITYLVVTIAEKSGLNTGLARGTSSLRLYLEVNKNRASKSDETSQSQSNNGQSNNIRTNKIYKRIK